MIFVTVGAQMPFDRLVRTVDEWANVHGSINIFAQIGQSEYKPRCFQAVKFLNGAEFRERVRAATLVVSHAGIGSIITALEFGKPLLVMPRRGNLKETRNDHQVATAQYLAKQGRIAVAFNETELLARLDRMEDILGGQPISDVASHGLVDAVQSFIECGTKPMKASRFSDRP